MNKIILIILTAISAITATDYFDTCTAIVLRGKPGAIIPDTMVFISYGNSGDAFYGFRQRIEIDINGKISKLQIMEYLDSAIGDKIRTKDLQDDSCFNCNKISEIINIINQADIFNLKCVSDFATAVSGGWSYSVYCKFGNRIHSINITDMDNSVNQKEYVIIKEIFNNKNLFKFSKNELTIKYCTNKSLKLTRPAKALGF